MKIIIDNLTNSLNSNPNVTVEFLTKTGKIRVMNCTRLTTVPGGDNPKLNGPDIIAVFDLLVNEWRAFRKDSVKSYQVQH